MPANLPIWVTLSLSESWTTEEFCKEAAAHGVDAKALSDGRIQLPHGFLAWLDPEPFPENQIDDSAAEETPEIGPSCLHISGGTNELERQAHQQPAAVREATAALRDRLAEMTTFPGTAPRIISGAAAKAERLTGILQGLSWCAASVVFPHAGNIVQPAEDFVARSREFEGAYHNPIYAFNKVRPDADGPYASCSGLFLFALPDMAIPLADGVEPVSMVRAMANLQREMVAEGWWPENGATFETEIGPVRVEQVQDALFVVPTGVAITPQRLGVARHRWALERCAIRSFGRGTMFRVRTPDLVVDHHQHSDGKSFAISNGASLVAQKGGGFDDENWRVEVFLMSDRLGPWATKFVAYANETLRGHDGSHPLRPFDRLAFPQPIAGLGGMVLWPWGHFTPYGEAAGPDWRVHLWCLVPILTEELARFRAEPTAQRAWREERIARRDLSELFERWEQVAG
jgi:hypothetical protein